MSLRSISWCGFLILLGVSPSISRPREQVTRDQNPGNYDQLLAAARSYASQYLAGLPNFTCSQVLEQFESDKKGRRWRKGDVLTSQLVWNQGAEQRTLQLVNRRPASGATFWREPLVTEGEFGSLLDSVLSGSSKVEFAWRGWEHIKDKLAAVFTYRVDPQNSPWKLALGAAEAKIAFHGLVYSDAETGTVWRITNDADEFPAALKTKSVARTVEYGEVAIGDARYVLPLHASVLLDTGKGQIRNELHFQEYRKFVADSHISFTSADASAGIAEPTKR